jgi:hypothetical protein
MSSVRRFNSALMMALDIKNQEAGQATENEPELLSVKLTPIENYGKKFTFTNLVMLRAEGCLFSSEVQ